MSVMLLPTFKLLYVDYNDDSKDDDKGDTGILQRIRCICQTHCHKLGQSESKGQGQEVDNVDKTARLKEY